MSKLTLFLSIAFISFSSFAYSQDNQSDGRIVSAVQVAEKSYQLGDIQKSLVQLEKILKEKPDDPRAQRLYTEVLVAASLRSYLTDDEEASFKYLSKAMEITPEIEKINRLYEKVRKQTFNVSQEEAPKPETQNFERMFEKVLEAQEKALSMTQGTLNSIVQNTAEEKNKILESLDKRETLLVEEIKFGRKYSIWMILGGVLLVVCVVFAVLFLIQRIASRREKIFLEQGERFAQIVQQNSGKALEQIKETLMEQPGSEVQNRLALENASEKLHRIDIIDAEIVQEGKESPVIDTTVLKTLLEDPNPEVKTRTIQVLLKYDPEWAYQAIQQMLLSLSSETRVLAVKLLGGVATQKSAEILIKLLKSEDSAVKRESIVALRSLMKEGLSEATKNEIDIALAFVSQSEGWIVK